MDCKKSNVKILFDFKENLFVSEKKIIFAGNLNLV